MVAGKVQKIHMHAVVLSLLLLSLDVHAARIRVRHRTSTQKPDGPIEKSKQAFLETEGSVASTSTALETLALMESRTSAQGLSEMPPEKGMEAFHETKDPMAETSSTPTRIVLMETQLQYKTYTNHTNDGKYLLATMRLEYFPSAGDSSASLMLTSSDLYGNSFPVDRSAVLQIQLSSERSGKYPVIIWKQSSDSPGYVKFRVPRSRLGLHGRRSSSASGWKSHMISSAWKELVVKESVEKAEPRIHQFKGQDREGLTLMKVVDLIETRRALVNMRSHSCFLEGACLSVCPPPVRTQDEGLVCPSKHFCRLEGTQCTPVAATRVSDEEWDDSALVMAWDNAVTDLASKVNALDGAHSKARIAEVVSAAGFLGKIRRHMLKNGPSFKAMPSLLDEVRDGTKFPGVLQNLAKVMDDQNVLGNLAEEKGCPGVKLRIAGKSAEEQDVQVKQAVDQCPQLVGEGQALTSNTSTALMQRVEFTDALDRTGLDPLSWAVIITLGLAIAFAYGANQDWESPAVGTFFVGGAFLCWGALLFEVMVVCAGIPVCWVAAEFLIPASR